MSDLAPAEPRVPMTDAEAAAIERPAPVLLNYYFWSSIIWFPFFIFIMPPRYFRFRSMRYHIDAEGITMRWGILFRKEVTLAYSRIQDIHLTANFIERWLGLARIQIQTASGAASAEMVIEGILRFEELRDFLYGKMRGIRDPEKKSPGDDLGEALRAVTVALEEVRGALHQLSHPNQVGMGQALDESLEPDGPPGITAQEVTTHGPS